MLIRNLYVVAYRSVSGGALFDFLGLAPDINIEPEIVGDRRILQKVMLTPKPDSTCFIRVHLMSRACIYFIVFFVFHLQSRIINAANV